LGGKAARKNNMTPKNLPRAGGRVGGRRCLGKRKIGMVGNPEKREACLKFAAGGLGIWVEKTGGAVARNDSAWRGRKNIRVQVPEKRGGGRVPQSSKKG